MMSVYNTVTNLVLGAYRNYTTRAFGTRGIIIDIPSDSVSNRTLCIYLSTNYIISIIIVTILKPQIVPLFIHKIPEKFKIMNLGMCSR